MAIVHEWLTNMAGSEKCVDAMREAFPLHHIYTSVYNPDVFPDWEDEVTTSPLQRVRSIRRSHIVGLPMMLPAMRRLHIGSQHDLVIRSFHSFATAPRPPAEVPEVVYCYTPPRFIYRRDSLLHESLPIRVAARAAAILYKRGDQQRMRRGALAVAISTHVAQRIESVYGIRAGVIHPPVEVGRFREHSGAPRDDYFVFCSRLVPYKRPDVAIEAFRSLPYRLLVAGDGRLRDRLEQTAPPNVTFLGRVADSELPRLLANARGLVFPAEEDFGIAPVEALAAGTPVVALGRGGARDYIQPDRNGYLVDNQTPADFAGAIRALARRDWDHRDISSTAEPFGRERFVQKIRGAAAELLDRS